MLPPKFFNTAFFALISVEVRIFLFTTSKIRQLEVYIKIVFFIQ